jgi:hypothetical protein
MQVKKEVVVAVQSNLQNELDKVRSKIASNKFEIKKLAEAQALLKRERNVFCDLIWKLGQHVKGIGK